MFSFSLRRTCCVFYLRKYYIHSHAFASSPAYAHRPPHLLAAGASPHLFPAFRVFQWFFSEKRVRKKRIII